MMEMLINRYRDRRKIYLSWDAASWHISKQLSNVSTYTMPLTRTLLSKLRLYRQVLSSSM